MALLGQFLFGSGAEKPFLFFCIIFCITDNGVKLLSNFSVTLCEDEMCCDCAEALSTDGFDAFFG